MYLKETDVLNVLRILSEGRELFVPGTEGKIKKYRLWQGEMPELGEGNTILPPKDILFPKTEKMYSFKTGDNMEISENTEAPERVIFGLRPCDVHSFMCMDAVFINKAPTDSYYARRRAKSLLVAVSCRAPGENCFCEAMGLDPNAAPNADIFLTGDGEGYFVTAGTDKGRLELEKWSDYLTEKSGDAPKAHCTLSPNMSEALSHSLEKHFEDEKLWRFNSETCIGCGTCAFVCPTCYCFDIDSSVKGDEGYAFRCWDTCMFSDYNMNAGGHNTRPTKKERLRNRYLHKLSFFSDRHGMTLCAGCGRCIEKCPAHLDITEFIDHAAEVCNDKC